MSHFVIRPGQTEYDAQSRISGHLSLPLTNQGHREIGEIIDSLKDVPLDAIYTAGTEQSLSTAIAVADALDCDIKVVEALTNMNLGLWQGLRVDDLRTRQPRVFKLWQDCPDAVCPPLGETCEDVFERIATALRKPLRRGKHFAVVAGEPLATIVEGVLRGDRNIQKAGPLCRSASKTWVQITRVEIPVAV
ncbi:MAG: histidine phosphatase family protein [Planctomycetaceae bacterium]